MNQNEEIREDIEMKDSLIKELKDEIKGLREENEKNAESAKRTDKGKGICYLHKCYQYQLHEN